jgi:cephalosporin hydroxylase
MVERAGGFASVRKTEPETPELLRRRLGPQIEVRTPEGPQRHDIYTPEGFEVLSQLWTRSGWQQKVTYEVSWLGIPIIQTPEDIVMMQELLWKVRPDVVVECGLAHGGSAMLYASVLELLGKGRVIGIDVEIRKHNRLALLSHPLSHRLTMIESSSVESSTADRVRSLIGPEDRVLVTLDSNHARDHVRRELELYSSLVTAGSYIVVFDGVMQILTDAPGGSPAWDDDNPWVAVTDFLGDHPEFEIDAYYNRLRATYCPGGFLRRARQRAARE